MKQIAQSINGGLPRLVDVPPPMLRPGGVLVRTVYSLVSAGTDRLTVDLAGKSLLGKARSRPDQVGKVLKKLRTEGIASTLDAVRSRLAGDLPLGYSAAGRVVAVAPDVDMLRVGDAVACAGMGYASHAETIFVPANLATRVPGSVDLRAAATVTLGAIALQGVRRADLRLGEKVGVIGLGILGLLTVQMLRASGCHVLSVDLDDEKVRLSERLGAELALNRGDGDLEARARAFGGGRGLDAVLVTAGTASSDPLALAASMSRLGGRVVVVGAVGMDLPRRPFYMKELDLRMARSYGPGRYDPEYEEKGRDYPYEYVRFTEGRNMEAYLRLIARGEVDVEPLLTHEFGIEQGEQAYRLLMSERGRSVVGLLFHYPEDEREPESARLDLGRGRAPGGSGVGVGLVGAGLFARGVLLPALLRMPDFRPTGVVTASGLSAVNAAGRSGFAFAATRVEELLEDADTDAVVIATRHARHAAHALAALRAGKDVFVEKPLALDGDELDALVKAVEETGRILMVGFNRRFAPTYRCVRDALKGRASPLHAVYRIDAGHIPPEHWTRDMEEGGGRILGEVCHFVDLLIHLAGCEPRRVTAHPLPAQGVTATIEFSDASVATVIYATGGDGGHGKERLEAFADGTSAVLDDFRAAAISSGGRARRVRAGPGKGHKEEIRAFLTAVREGRPSPVAFRQAVWSTRATLAILDSISGGRTVVL